ncbi:uncharacterized protein UV8b_07630 [Ustilaginoidea virens]|uniref:Sulfatase N-terminal domain-containing protein n=1 Tax=Ustilaginoidea virens TaxID=1159556 RepID=A0A063BK83_USTVR|nr:uncharacterized protein UV8b_07630 [Ustilaginoidea virens]QUC23389.1 hypothetical protein UV8b_07630 [Ustilaginoidea virens]GAO19640.1 hypothetical protein UVI_02045670 [Ustilaginoidea virens]
MDLSASGRLSPRPRRHASSADRLPSPSPSTPCLSTGRLLSGLVTRFFNRRFAFALPTVCVLGSKVVHICSHKSALSAVHFKRWSFSFFAQDLLLILLFRFLFDKSCLNGARWVQLAGKTLAWLLAPIATALGVFNVCFFLLTGAEVHWRNIAFASDASSRALLLSGLLTLVTVASCAVLTAWALQDLLYLVAGMATDTLKWPLRRFVLRRPQGSGSIVEYTALDDSYDDDNDDNDDVKWPKESLERASAREGKPRRCMPLLRAASYALVAIVLIAQVVCTAIRPHESSLIFLSWTSILLPFVDFSSTSPNLKHLLPYYNNGINYEWDNRTALLPPTPLPWLSQEPKIPGFDDWYKSKKHYNASADPLKISNLGSELLPLLREKLGDVEIRHVVIIFLESTRKDVFPLKKHGMIDAKLSDTYVPGHMPKEVEERLATLTPTANYLTGDYDDGFEHETRRARGGISFNNAYTTATYTLKSLTGTLCGVTPLLADFNLEYNHHIYQPCLAQIFEALNHVDGAKDDEPFVGYKWVSSFMQSVTFDFDKFGDLMLKLGFPADRLIDREYLKSDKAKFGRVDLPDVNYFGMVEAPLEDYIRDAFASAEKKKERVFLTHITSTSHHPFGMPRNETYVPLSKTGHDDLSHYLNAIGYDDRWLAKIVGMLDEHNVANETLLVVLGDHGLSMPENDIVSAYYNPNVGSNHVPLVISHPHLPAMSVDEPVIASQILPTILDVLVETKSLGAAHKRALRDLMANYEGQSLLRKQEKAGPDGRGNWQFTILNPGRAMLSVRDARQPSLRLIVPVIDNIEWQLTNVSSDPKEQHPIAGFNFASFLEKIEDSHGVETAEWAEEAAFVSRWWVEENSKRWRYGPWSE